MLRGDRNLVDRDYNGELVGIDGEGVEEGVIRCSWDVVPISVEHHISEIIMGEVDVDPCDCWHGG